MHAPYLFIDEKRMISTVSTNVWFSLIKIHDTKNSWQINIILELYAVHIL